MREEPRPVISRILSMAADSCSAAATQAYLQRRVRTCPEAPRELSDAILQLTSHAKRAQVACGELSKHTHVWQRPTRSRVRSHSAARGTVAIEATDHMFTSSGTAQHIFEQADHETGCSLAGVEAALVLAAGVRGIERETELLEAIVQHIDLRTYSDRLEACRELLSVRPFICEEVLSASEGAIVVLQHAQSEPSERPAA